jgi:hypothetical protein
MVGNVQYIENWITFVNTSTAVIQKELQDKTYRYDRTQYHEGKFVGITYRNREGNVEFIRYEYDWYKRGTEKHPATYIKSLQAFIHKELEGAGYDFALEV